MRAIARVKRKMRATSRSAFRPHKTPPPPGRRAWDSGYQNEKRRGERDIPTPYRAVTTPGDQLGRPCKQGLQCGRTPNYPSGRAQGLLSSGANRARMYTT